MFSPFSTTRVLKTVFLQLVAVVFCTHLQAQLIVNEVSQGASGTKEYVELLTVGTPGCSSTPCVDLRGWYIDDNNGLHATGSGTGIATGCIRFTNDATWSCVPIGTLIVVYNDADPNTSIPAQDLSMSDGNCRLIIPVSNCALLEKHASQPSTASSVYPVSAFTPCGAWSPLGMSNSDDSFQTLDPSGNLIHSVSWGNNTLNTIIYFAGSSGGMVSCMLNTTDNNPNLQSNWSRLPVGGNESPGTGNNAANSAWISSMNNNCTAIVPLTVSTTAGPPTCTCNGTATATASGSVGPYTYSWAPSGGTNATATGLCPGSYTVTATSAAGCTETAVVTISPSPSLTLTITSSDISCNGAANGSATVNASGGTGLYSYNWLPSGGTGSTANGLGAGTYTVSVSDNGGCSATLAVTITEPAVLTTAASQNNITCNGGTNGSATVSVLGGTSPYQYSWSPSGGTNPTATNLSAGNYTCTITDANSCTTTQSFTITQPAPFNITNSSNAATCGNSNGNATVSVSGGTPGYTYSWAPTGGTTASASNLPAGIYTCTITDANGCSTSVMLNIANTAGPTATIASSATILCFGDATGSAVANVNGGTPNYTYAWSPSGGTNATATGLAAGSYTCTVTDANSCISIATVTLTSPAAITASATSVDASCNASNGSATAIVSGGTPGYSYSWSPTGGNAATANGIPAGNYTCTITDANGCIETVNATINNASGPAVTSASSSVLCFGGSTGTAVATANGGTAPYVYQWNPIGGTNDTATGLPAGNYTCTVTDNNGCVNSVSVIITQPSQLSVTVSSTPASCSGSGTATASVNGGTPGYTYNWLPTGGTNATANNLSAGTYSVTATDLNGCTTTQTITVTQATSITSTISSTTNNCFGGNNATATVTPLTGNPPFTYSWSSGGTAATESGLAAGTYTCTITDASGCTDTQTVTITQPAQLSATAVSTNNLCSGSNNGSATVSVSGGTPGYLFAWSPTGGNNAVANGLAAGTYSCTVTDANGCVTTQTVTITQPSSLTATASQNNVLCNGTASGSASINVNGGTPGYTYSWTPSGGTNSTAASLNAGTYTCTITDLNGCVTTQTVIITQPAALNAVATGDNICGGAPAQISASGAGGVGPYTYVWSDNSTAATHTVNVALTTTFTVTITDANGCSATANAIVTITSAPVASISSNAVNGYFNLSDGSQLCFTDASQGSVSWDWDLNGTPFSGQSPSCIILTNADSGQFCVNLTVENSAGCRDSSDVCITIGEVYLTVPNVFTPNGDGTNDLFFISSRGLSELHVEIFDRWGVLVNVISETGQGWDGRSTSGMEVSDGTYYYVLSASASDGKIYSEKGFVTLFR
ncbi:MAG: gliding motility-associated C-terminal domain-containing protein [Bacteroidota bacterium]|nr:gliding motility-associated C-terminal domain-containing protein [Bacteroidota bacterium]